MDWKSRIPEGVKDLQETPDGIRGAVTVPADEDGYIGRRCAGCEGKFRMLSDEYVALPDGTQLTRPYCGREDDAGAFMTDPQRERARAALMGICAAADSPNAGRDFRRASPERAVAAA